MKSKLSNFVDLIATFEEPTRGFVAQIVESQVLNIEHSACSSESGADALGIVREDIRTVLRLALYDLPRLLRVLKLSVVTLPGRRMLRVTDPARASFGIVVVPCETADLSLPAG